MKDAAGGVHHEGKIGSTRRELDGWIRTMPQPRMIAMEATIFTGWIYDHLLPHAETVKVDSTISIELNVLDHVTVSSQPQSFARQDFVPIQSASGNPLTVFEGAIINGREADSRRPRGVRGEGDGQTSSSYEVFVSADRDKYPCGRVGGRK